MAIASGSGISSNDILGLQATMFKNYAQLLFNTAHVGWDAQLNVATGVPNNKNIHYFGAASDAADTNYGFVWDGANQYYYLRDLSSANLVYFDIYATTCNKGYLIAPGIWRYHLTETSKDLGINKAMVALFAGLGAGATQPNGITGLTEIRCSEAAYRGTKVRFIQWTGSNSGSGAAGLVIQGDIAFSASGTKYVICNFNASTNSGTVQSEFPEGTNLHTSTTDDYNTSTIHSAADNDAQHYGTNTNTLGGWTFSYTNNQIWIRPSAETMTFTETTETSCSMTLTESGDISISSSAPDTATYPLGTGTLIFNGTASSTATNSISTWNSSVDASSTLVTSLSYNSGSNYTAITDSTIQRITPTGTGLRMKFVITRTDLSKQDKIAEFATIYNLY